MRGRGEGGGGSGERERLGRRQGEKHRAGTRREGTGGGTVRHAALLECLQQKRREEEGEWFSGWKQCLSERLKVCTTQHVQLEVKQRKEEESEEKREPLISFVHFVSQTSLLFPYSSLPTAGLPWTPVRPPPRHPRPLPHHSSASSQLWSIPVWRVPPPPSADRCWGRSAFGCTWCSISTHAARLAASRTGSLRGPSSSIPSEPAVEVRWGGGG